MMEAKMPVRVIAGAALGVLLLVLPAASTVYYVDAAYGNDSCRGLRPYAAGPDGPKCAIQAAISVTTDGDEVIVATGTYSGTGNRDLDFGGRRITVRSTNPLDPVVVASTVINCEGEYASRHRGFRFSSGEGRGSIVAGLTITAGFAPVEQIEGEFLSAGGAIFCDNASPTIVNCNISGNWAADKGGGIYSRAGQPLLASCGIGQNHANYGGGVYCGGASATKIVNCNVTGNSAGLCGGGVYLGPGDVSVVDNCFIGTNKAFAGGGIYCNTGGSAAAIRDCRIVGNLTSSLGAGGGILFTGDCSALLLQHNVVVGNGANEGGGICCYKASNLAIRNCTISGNRATRVGSAVFCMNSQGFITGSIIADNSIATCPQIALDADQTLHSGFSITYSLVDDGPSSIDVGDNSSVDWSAGNLAAEACFVQPGLWVGDVWVDGDYHLRSRAGHRDSNLYYSGDLPADYLLNVAGFMRLVPLPQQAGGELPPGANVMLDDVSSPCIDRGDPAGAGSEELWPHGRRTNMGAFGGTVQASHSESVTGNVADLNKDGVVNLIDFAGVSANWSKRQMPLASDMNGSGQVDQLDLVIFVEQWQWREP